VIGGRLHDPLRRQGKTLLGGQKSDGLRGLNAHWATCSRISTPRSCRYPKVDAIMMPAAATGATAYDDNDGLVDIGKLLSLLFMAYWNAMGYPALAVPMGFTAGGLPLFLQIAGRPFEESQVLKVGDAFQGSPTGTCGYRR
jgi:Asp-tRNA(Asn)/Glu-tRNA(Gln) amidotransferase A subunit family amidase